MHHFVQIHLLTFYPPANLNRDDTGRPKSAIMGGVERLRVSSQAIKRAIRTSAVFRQALNEHLGVRTQRFGEEIEAHLREKKAAPPEKAREIARRIAKVFGKVEEPTGGGAPIARTAQLAFIGPEERQAAIDLAERLLEGATDEVEPDRVLKRADTAVDIAMFGRMLADNADFNREAAVQVAHAVTTHKAAIEDDYYTAVDDLKKPSEDAGAGFVGELGFGSGVFYLYVCIDKLLLLSNLEGDKALATTGLKALTEALATVAPTGKQASFASRARADFILAEKGDQQPRTLASAFVKPVAGSDILVDSIARLKTVQTAMDAAYGACSESWRILDVQAQQGSLEEIKEFVAED